MADSPHILNLLDEMVTGAFQYGYDEVLKKQDIWHKPFWYQETTPDEAVNIRWLEDRFALREGKRKTPPIYREFLGHQTRLVLRKWEDALRADIFDVSADRHGQIIRKAQQLGATVQRLPQDLIIEIFNLGETSAFTTFDGVPLYDNAHPKGDTTFDNLLAGTLSKATFQAARTAMRRFPSDEGTAHPLDIVPTDLFVPPDLEYTAFELMNSSFIISGAGEQQTSIKGMADVRTDARFTDTDDWGLVANLPFLPAYVRVVHKDFGKPILVSEMSVTDPGFRDHEEYRWWLRLYEAMYPTKPEFHLKVIN